jgi:hypothetical protein
VIAIDGPGRCPACSQHVATQGHAPGCLRASRLTRAEARVEAAAQRRAAIDACGRCDSNGFVDVDPSGSAVRHCDHRPVRPPPRDWLSETEDRRDAIAQRLAELDGGERDDRG